MVTTGTSLMEILEILKFYENFEIMNFKKSFFMILEFRNFLKILKSYENFENL